MNKKLPATTAPVANNLNYLKFDAINIPSPWEPIQKNNDIYTWYGIDNLYPDFLLKLYNGSPVHSSIVNSKVNYVIGDGLRYVNDVDTAIEIKVNAADSFPELITKAVKDYLLFNAFAIEVVYNKFKQPIEYHSVPVNRIRMNKLKTRFWVSENWQYFFKPVIFDRWKVNPDNTTSTLFYFDGYNPSAHNVYPLPEYFGAVTSILTDMSIRDFNLNNITNSFSVSSIITFFRGSNIAKEIKDQIVTDLKKSYSGSTGGKMIIDFQDPNQPAASVTNISPNEWDKAYSLIAESTKNDIIQAHQVTSPMLFGIATPGQLGASQELETAYEIFQNTYGKTKRNELESAFNLLFSNSGMITGKLAFAQDQLFSARISEPLKEKIFTVNELRKEANMPPMADGDKLLSDYPAISERIPTAPIPAPTNLSAKFSNNVFELSEEDFEKIKDLGELKESFEFVEVDEFVKTKEQFNKIELKFETMDEVANYITDNKLKKLSVKNLNKALRKDLAITMSGNELKVMLTHLNKAGVIKIAFDDSEDSDVATVSDTDVPRTIEVRYQYSVRPDLGAPIIRNTRAFCRRLIENNRFYTIGDIQSMSATFGYDIMSYGGGFYNNPDSGEITPYCRHQWEAVTVSRINK